MSGLGAMMVGGTNKKRGREKDDFYPTPRDCTIALMHAEDTHIPSHVWEPACGDGALAEILKHHGRWIEASDLVDRGYGRAGKDFLLASELLAPAIITNPPFNLAAQFIEKAYGLGAEYVALLLKSTFWHAANRSGLFARYQPNRIHAMTWRPDFIGGKAPTMEAMWCVWDFRADPGVTEYRLMPHPRSYIAGAKDLFNANKLLGA